MRLFFQNQFDCNHAENEGCLQVLIDQEDQIDPFCIRQFSHILNHHYIWMSRLKGEKPGSELWDVLPLDYWHSFNRENQRSTQEYLKHADLTEEYLDAEALLLEHRRTSDILQHILKHSVYHRAQINLRLRDLGLSIPSTEFVRINKS